MSEVQISMVCGFVKLSSSCQSADLKSLNISSNSFLTRLHCHKRQSPEGDICRAAYPSMWIGWLGRLWMHIVLLYMSKEDLWRSPQASFLCAGFPPSSFTISPSYLSHSSKQCIDIYIHFTNHIDIQTCHLHLERRTHHTYRW